MSICYRVLFVCLGNICRSPAAEVVLTRAVCDAGLEDLIEVDSCGTASYHVGQKPDSRMLAALERAGFVYGGHRARAFRRSDFERFNLIIPQDDSNARDVLALARRESERAKVVPMSRWFPSGCRWSEVPDPYYGSAKDFDEVVRLLAASVPSLLEELRLRLTSCR